MVVLLVLVVVVVVVVVATAWVKATTGLGATNVGAVAGPWPRRPRRPRRSPPPLVVSE